MSRLSASSHGESRLRLLRIVRRGDRHDPRDLTVSIRLEGDSAQALLEGRAAGVIPGEPLKRLVHQVAREHAQAEIEALAFALCARLLAAHPRLTRVRVDVAEQPWHRLDVGGKPQGQAFSVGGSEQMTAAVTSNGVQTAVVAGVEHLILMRTSGLLGRAPGARADDGSEDAIPSLFVGSLSARWTYSNAEVTFGPYRQGVRAAVTNTFATHATRSIEQTLYAIADVVLATYEEIVDVSLSMQEHPYRPADLFQMHAENPDEIFITTDAPVGIIDVRVERDQVT